LEGAHTRTGKFSFHEVQAHKKPVIKYAEDFTVLAGDWEVKLPKDFDKQAAEYQAELEAAIKEIKKS
jgi:hypothetical protein